ncbi:MAG: TlpA family protein disulfide reductase [Rickettsiales bacterium]|jgi:thiol-disulfide isomerase/thioredoxin|nr:TlpA family protein disulfide reductase [Rickettsiales bacterium]
MVRILLLAICTSILMVLASHTARAGDAPVIRYRIVDDTIQSPDFSAHKLTAVHFWATWCVPCIDELPEIEKTITNYKGKGLHILPIAMENNVKRIEEFFVRHKLTSIKPYRDDGITSFKSLGIRGLPTTVFFDSSGKEISRAEGPMPWLHEDNIRFLDSNLK